MRGFFAGLLQCVLASPRRGDKLMLNYDSEQKGKKTKKKNRRRRRRRKKCERKKRKTDLPLVTRTKSKKT